MKKLILFMTALAASAALAQAQQQQPAPDHSTADAGPNSGPDPNQMICRSQATLGSRLARQRVCATRQQWLDQRRADRDLAEKAQTRRIWCKEGVPC